MSSTIRPLIQATYEQVSDDTKLVRLTTITKLIHSVLFLYFMATNIYRVIIRVTEGSEAANQASGGINEIFLRITNNFPLSEYGGILLIIGIVLVVGYYLFPTIGEGALISYLADDEKKGSKALVQGFGHFFKMFEYRGMTSIFSPLFFIIIASRVWTMDVLSNGLVLGVIILWGAITVFTMIFFSFAQYYIVLHNTKAIEAMIKSTQLSAANMGKIIRTVILQFFLSISFIINIILFFGLPLLIFYLRIQFGGEINGMLGTIIIIIAIMLSFFLSYINGIIESFFITLRYRLFVQLQS